MTVSGKRSRGAGIAAAGILLLLLAGAAPAAGAGPGGGDPLVSLARERKSVVIADFGLGMCRQCKAQAAILERVESAYGDKVVVRMVAVNRERELTARYAVETIPCLVFLDPAGEIRHRRTGVMSFREIEGQLRRMGVTP